VDPVIPSAGIVDPGQPPQIVVVEGEEERVYSRNVDGLTAELVRTRGKVAAATKETRETRAALEAAQARIKALEPIAAEVDALKPAAERWREHERAQSDKLKEANAVAIAALTPEQRAAFEGITDEPTIARMLTLVKAQAAASAPASYPAGGAAPVSGGGAGADLTPAEEAWVRSERKDLAGLEVSTIKAMFKKFGPK